MSRLRSRPRRTVEEARRPLLVLAGAATLALSVLAVLLAFGAERGLPGESFLTVDAQVAELGTLGAGDEVRIAGRRVGRVGDIRLVEDVPTVALELEDSARPLPVDSTVRLRPRGLLGSQYVEVVPGTSDRELPAGATIPLTKTSTAVPLADVLDALDPPRRRALGAVLRGLGTGVAGRGAGLNDTLAVAPTVIGDVSRALEPLLDRPGTAARLVRHAGVLAAALDPVRDDLARGFGDGEAALAPFARERDALAATLDVAPGALRATRTALTRIDPALDRAARFARAADRFTGVAPAGLEAATSVLREARRPLADLDALLRSTDAAVGPTLALTEAVDPVLPRLTATFELAREPSRILGPYGCDIRGFGANWRSFLGYAPVGQTGPLGPQTILRTSLGVPSSQTPNTGPGFLAGSGVDGSPAPCRPEGGRGPR